MQGSSDETANSVEEGSSGPGSSSGCSEASSNEAASSRASQSACSPGSEMHSDDMGDSEALKEEEEDEENEDDEEQDEEEDEGNQSAVEDGQQKAVREQTESRKRKAGEALCDVPSHGVGPIGSGAGTKTKVLSFSPETSTVMVTAVSSTLEGHMKMLDTCSSSSARPEGIEHQQVQDISPCEMVQRPQEPSCLQRPGDFLGEPMSSELFNCRRFIGPQHHHHHHHPHHHHHHHEG